MVSDGRLTDLVPDFVSKLLHRFDDNKTDSLSTDDVFPLRLEDFDAKNSVFAQVMSEIKDEIRRQSAPQRRIHNESSRINRLPVETLGNIFAYLLPHTRYIEMGVERYERLLDLSHVCGHWHNVFHGTPELWSYIEFGYSDAMLQTSLDKSGNHPLTIVCSGHSLISGSLSPEQLQKEKLNYHSFLRFTTAQFYRCASATFPFMPLEHANYLEQTTAPMLQSLYVEYHPLVSNCFPRILDGDTPMLRAVSVRGCIPLGVLRILDTLTSLTIGEVELSDAESGEKLRVLLHSPRNLRYLHLVSISMDERGLDAVSSTTLSFPSLETLALRYVPPGLSDVLLRNVKTSNAIFLNFQSGWLNSKFDSLDDPLDPLKLRSVFEHIPEHGLLTIAVTSIETKFLAYSPDSGDNRGLELRVDTGRVTLSRVFQAFVNLAQGDFIPAPNHVTIKIGGYVSLGKGREWLVPLNELPSVVALELDGAKAITSILTELDFRDDMTGWYLPKIQSLTLLSNHSAAATLAVLQRRYQDRTPKAPGNTGNLVEPDPPTPLSLLSITDKKITPEVVQGLRDLLETSGILQWRKDRGAPWNID